MGTGVFPALPNVSRAAVRCRRHRVRRTCCRLHALLCEPIPGVPDGITAGQAAVPLSQVRPSGSVVQARCELAAELLADIGRLAI